MLKNYFKIAFRNLVRQKGYSFINIAGLAVGMASCILIFLYVQDELSYDRYHKKADQIFRILRQDNARTSFPLARTLADNFPEIIEAVRITDNWERLVSYEDKIFIENEFIFADPNIFEVFDFQFVKGNPKTALREPFSIVITEKIAKKYFGDDNPIGRILTIENEHNYTVTGVLKEIPRRSHFKFDFLATFVRIENVILWPGAIEHWGATNAYTYLLLSKNSSIHELETKFTHAIVKTLQEKNPELDPPQLRLQRLTDIHLYSADISSDIEPQGDITYIIIYSAIAIFILLIACINFINLSTARSTTRVKEVGMRKVVGASRVQLIKQFLIESIIFSIIAFLFSIILIELFLPTLNSLIGKELSITYSANLNLFLTFAVIIIFVGIVAGSYPAFFLSGFQPVLVLKNVTKTGSKNNLLRKFLVINQFTIAITLIIGTYIIFNQLHYLRNKKLGFDKEHLLITEIPNPDALVRNELFMNKLLQQSKILNVSTADRVPPDHLGWWTTFRPKGIKNNIWLPIVPVTFDYFKTLGIQMKEGRAFSREFASDTSQALVLNEAAVRKLELISPIGQQIEVGFNHPNKMVIGVVNDFHFESLYEKIQPIAFVLDPRQSWQMLIRIRPGNVSKTINFIKKEWLQFYPEWVFQYSFLDDKINQQYLADEKTGRIIGYFTSVAILIACLGLFGLASFMTEQRIKEIGIRKILGASVPDILVMLTKNFTAWVLIANLIAWPISYYTLNKWLQNFAYRIDITISPFLLAGLAALVIALLTVSWQAIRAATANPVESLRNE